LSLLLPNVLHGLNVSDSRQESSLASSVELEAEVLRLFFDVVIILRQAAALHLRVALNARSWRFQCLRTMTEVLLCDLQVELGWHVETAQAVGDV